MNQVDLKLTPEQIKAMEELAPIEIDREFKYTPKAYRVLPKSEWPVFTLMGKDGLQVAEEEDNSGHFQYNMVTKTQTFIPSSGKRRIGVLQCGLKGWSNYKKSGKVIKYPSTVDEALRHLPAKLQVELQNAINENAVMTEEELRGLE